MKSKLNDSPASASGGSMSRLGSDVGSDAGSDTGMYLSDSEGSDAGMRIPEEEEGQGVDTCPSAWHPGKDCGQWMSGLKDFSVQAQVLICNVYLNLRRLPSKVAATALGALSREGSAATRNFADKLAAALLGLSFHAARTVYNRVSDKWRPEQREPKKPSDSELPRAIAGSSKPSNFDLMKIRVREILAICHGGKPDSDYPLAMERLCLHGLQVGDTCTSRRFVEPVELLAATAARAEAARRLNCTSPSLGVRSDVAVIWDGVSIGARSFSRYETLYLVGAVFMDFSISTPGMSQGAPGASQERPLTTSCLLAGPSAGQKHTGQEQAALMLAEHPAALTTRVLKTRLAAIGSDGAAAKGGPDANHPSTGGSELMWDEVHRGKAPVVEWDVFHRVDLATSKAISDNKGALEVFDVARVLGQLFGNGDGRVIFRSAAAAIGIKHLRVPDQSGTRKVVALTRTVQRLLQSLPTYQAGLHACCGQAEGQDSNNEQKTRTFMLIYTRNKKSD